MDGFPTLAAMARGWHTRRGRERENDGGGVGSKKEEGETRHTHTQKIPPLEIKKEQGEEGGKKKNMAGEILYIFRENLRLE